MEKLISKAKAPAAPQEPKGQMVGYARTSTAEQEAGLAAQERDLKAAGCTRLYTEQVSSVAQRPELAKVLDYVREGDTLVVTKPDRLARSTFDLLTIAKQLEAKGVALLVLSMGGKPVDSRDAQGKLMLTMLAAIAEFERELMLERQREGIAKAKKDGRYKGRAPTAMAKADEVRKLHKDGIGAVAIARKLGIGRASVYRALKPIGQTKI